MEKISKAIDILTAIKNGDKVQWSHDGNTWHTLENYTDDFVMSYIYEYEWRIAPKDVYRPYETKEEFIQDSIKHGFWMSDEDGDTFMPMCVDRDGLVIMTSYALIGSVRRHSLRGLLGMFIWEDDKTPCGVLANE